MILALAMGALSIFRGFQQAESAKQQAEVAEQNAQYASELAVNNAEIEKKNRQMQSSAEFDTYRRQRAIQEASYATSGVLLDGTPSKYLQAQVETDEVNMDRQDQASYQRQLGILYQGQIKSENLLNQAEAYKQSADNAILGGFIGAGSAMMTGGGAGSSFSWFGSGNKSAGASSGLTLADGAPPKTLLSDPYSPLKLGN